MLGFFPLYWISLDPNRMGEINLKSKTLYLKKNFHKTFLQDAKEIIALGCEREIKQI